MEFKVYLKKLRELEYDKKKEELYNSESARTVKNIDISSRRGSLFLSGLRRSSLAHIDKSQIVFGAIGSNGKSNSRVNDIQGSGLVQDLGIVVHDQRLPGRGQNYSYWRTAEGLFASNGGIRRRRRSSCVFVVDILNPEANSKSKADRSNKTALPGQPAENISVNMMQENSDKRSHENENEIFEISAKSGDPEYGLDEWMQQVPQGPRSASNGHCSDHDGEGNVGRSHPQQWTEAALRRKFEAEDRRRAEAESHRNRILAGSTSSFTWPATSLLRDPIPPILFTSS